MQMKGVDRYAGGLRTTDEALGSSQRVGGIIKQND